MSKTTNKLSPEVRERDLRRVFDNEVHNGTCGQAAFRRDAFRQVGQIQGKRDADPLLPLVM